MKLFYSTTSPYSRVVRIALAEKGLSQVEGVLTDPWRGQPLKSWVRTRGWTDDELDAACDRLRSRELLNGDDLTVAGRALREGIDDATDRMETRLVAALGSDAQQLFDLLDPWCDLIVADGGYPARVTWPA